MSDPLDVHVFRDPHFAPEGDTLICVVQRKQMERFISKREVSQAFSGYAVFRLRWPWNTYIGVWGKRNTSRFRRFLRERGADIVIHRQAIPGLRMFYWATQNERNRVRTLGG